MPEGRENASGRYMILKVEENNRNSKKWRAILNGMKALGWREACITLPFHLPNRKEGNINLFT